MKDVFQAPHSVWSVVSIELFGIPLARKLMLRWTSTCLEEHHSAGVSPGTCWWQYGWPCMSGNTGRWELMGQCLVAARIGSWLMHKLGFLLAMFVRVRLQVGCLIIQIWWFIGIVSSKHRYLRIRSFGTWISPANVSLIYLDISYPLHFQDHLCCFGFTILPRAVWRQ